MIILSARTTSSIKQVPGKQILSIQYLRAFAAAAVVVAHTGTFMFRGQAGVDVFFVISGFIMWTITVGKRDIYIFVRDRLLRVVPLYWIATIIMGLHQNAPLLAILKSMLFIPFIGEAEQIWPVLVQGWTLNYEIFFYALVAVSLLFPERKRLLLLITALIVLSCVGISHTFFNPMLATYTNPLLLEFGFGIALAEARLRFSLDNVVLAILLGIFAIGLFWLTPEDRLPGMFRFASWGVPSAMLVASALMFEGSGWVRRLTPLLVLGEASYATYLFHTYLVKTVMRLFSGGPFSAFGTAAVVLSAFLLGTLIAYFVEKPLLRFLRGRFKGVSP